VHRAQVDELFARYGEPVFRFLRRFLRDAAAAEDLTQEAFLRALRASYRSEGTDGAWVFQIARNLARDHLRARARLPPIDVLDDQPGVSGDRTLKLALDAALATLSKDDREVFLLKEVAGLSYADIAAACGLTPDAVRSRLHRARLALRRELT
jgi:RNA polymerase sigma-70 factor (ECF subfamily)